jgi:hypothetical protein
LSAQSFFKYKNEARYLHDFQIDHFFIVTFIHGQNPATQVDALSAASCRTLLEWTGLLSSKSDRDARLFNAP